MGVSKITEGDVRKSEADLQLLKDHAEILKEADRIVADIRWSKFQAHLEKGFTEAQAIELLKHEIETDSD